MKTQLPTQSGNQVTTPNSLLIEILYPPLTGSK